MAQYLVSFSGLRLERTLRCFNDASGKIAFLWRGTDEDPPAARDPRVVFWPIGLGSADDPDDRCRRLDSLDVSSYPGRDEHSALPSWGLYQGLVA
jgi:hypothetical protein